MDSKNVSKKDQIILQQLEVIRTMTEHNLNRMGGDFWGVPEVPPAKRTGGGANPPRPASPEASRNDGAAASTGDDDTKAKEAEKMRPAERIEDLQRCV